MVIMNELLGSRIRLLREKKGLTQEQVSEQLGCSRQKYSRIEKGMVDISYAFIVKIADILKIKPDDITIVLKNDENEPLFRNNQQENDGFDFISELIDVFYAHRKLYNSVKGSDSDE